jgi:DNA polymerase-1
MDIYLIDGSSYLYRAFYAIRGLRDSKGRPTNAIFGFTNMLMKLIKDLKPGGLAISFDTPHPTERHRLYKKYKAHRPETPTELVQQIPHVKKVVEAMRIRLFEVPGWEADDVLATMADKVSAAGHNAFIITGDKDMLQVVDGRIKIYDPMKNAVLGRDYVLERYGVPPGKVPDFMALVGDPVDNIPGVKGVGEKTAGELFGQFGSLDEIMAHPERIKKEKLRKLIEESIEDIKVWRELARVNREVPIEFDLNALALPEPDWRTLLAMFKEFEFTSLMKLIPGAPPPEISFRTVLDPAELGGVLSGLNEEFAISAHAAGASLIRSPMAGFSVCSKEGGCFYIPLAQGQMDYAEAASHLKQAMENERTAKTGHDMKRNLLLMMNSGIETKGVLYDTMIASHLLNPLRAGHGLETVVFEHLAVKKKTLEEVAGKGKGFADMAAEEAGRFSCEEAELSLELKELLFPRLEDEGLERAYFEIEMPLLEVLAKMEEAGVKVDATRLSALSRELDGELEALKSRIYFLAGGEFNINSPKQLAHVLFDVLGLAPGKKKKTGYSTEVGVLEELAHVHELPREVLDWRMLSKLKGTYVDVLPQLVNPATGRIHTSFNQTVTATGRLSSTEPNLQNVPIRGPWGRKVREAFVPEEGHLIISADYSQIELRVLAHLSGDGTLRRFFAEGLDIHSATASELFGVRPETVTPDQRRIAKSVNFGVVYGITPFGLSEAIGVDTGEAALYINRYFERHPGVREYTKKVIEEAKRDGFVRTMYGRKRPIPELKSPDARSRALGERLAMNSPVQGTAADIIKLAMIRISRKLEGTGTRLILQVHDELVFESPGARAEEMEKLIREEMAGAAGLSVPVEVQTGCGRNWAEAH